jgi:hypothetical protein
MNEKKSIIITVEDRDRVQKADVEMSSRMNLISFMISRNMDTSGEQFKRYEQEYKEAFLAFEAAKEHISSTYLSDINNVNWNLDYESCELTYEC